MKQIFRPGFLVFPLFLFFLSILLSGCGEKGKGPRIGEAAPDFTLPALDGTNITLSRLKGKKVLLLFWTQGCVFCQTRHILSVNEVYRKGKASGLEVLSINIAESKGTVARYVSEKRLIFPVLLDRYGSVSRKKFAVYLVPALFIIDQNGLIREKFSGYLTEETLHQFIHSYL
jgi:peroxiredoxin